jgi:DNA-binding transcriptional regulator YiaG
MSTKRIDACNRSTLRELHGKIRIEDQMEDLLYETSVTPSQCKAARALLDLTQGKLAGLADVGLSTIADFELGRRAVSAEKVQDIRLALEHAGIMFIDGDGLTLRRRRR